MSLNDETEAKARKVRFLLELQASNVLIDSMNEVIDRYEGSIKLRENQPERDLDLLVAAMQAKAGKTFQAVLQLCCLGFGEDALILLRSNVNLMINLLYILSGDAAQRAGDFIAFSHYQQEKYLRTAHGVRPSWADKLDWKEINKRAAEWKKLTIESRAKKAKSSFHYDIGYRFYSSVEHGDAWAVDRYVVEWNEDGPKISSEPSDQYVRIALVHNFLVMANIFLAFCSHFKIDIQNITAKLDETWKELGKNLSEET